MKADDIRRAALLIDALEDLPALEAAFDAGEEPQDGCTHVGFCLSVDDYTPHSGGSPRAAIYIDLVTAAQLMPIIREAITTRLDELGIERLSDKGSAE